MAGSPLGAALAGADGRLSLLRVRGPLQAADSVEAELRAQIEESGVEADTIVTVAEDPKAVLVRATEEHEILVLLPEPVAEGETTQIRVKWKSRWKSNNRTFAGRFMGATTSANRFLPELIPAPGGTVCPVVRALSSAFFMPPSNGT